MYFPQVSCLYLVLQLIYLKAFSKSLNQVSPSINNPMGHFSVISCILSFSAYQNMYFHKISCFYRVLKLIDKKTASKAWNRVPLSKNSTKGNFLDKFCILSFSAHHTLYFDKVSCFYLVLQDFSINITYKGSNGSGRKVSNLLSHSIDLTAFEWHHFWRSFLGFRAPYLDRFKWLYKRLYR